MVITSVDLVATDQLMIIYSFVKHLRKNENTMKSALDIHRLKESLYVIQLGGRSCMIFSMRMVFP
jgi:hypothetical protein